MTDKDEGNTSAALKKLEHPRQDIYNGNFISQSCKPVQQKLGILGEIGRTGAGPAQSGGGKGKRGYPGPGK